MLKKKVEERGIGIQSIGHHHVKCSWIIVEYPLQKPDGASDFPFAGPLRFGVDQKTIVQSSQQSRNIAVVVLRLLVVFWSDFPGHTAVAMPPVCCMRLMTIDNQRYQSVDWWHQAFVAFQLPIEFLIDGAQIFAVDQITYAPQ